MHFVASAFCLSLQPWSYVLFMLKIKCRYMGNEVFISDVSVAKARFFTVSRPPYTVGFDSCSGIKVDQSEWPGGQKRLTMRYYMISFTSDVRWISLDALHIKMIDAVFALLSWQNVHTKYRKYAMGKESKLWQKSPHFRACNKASTVSVDRIFIVKIYSLVLVDHKQ